MNRTILLAVAGLAAAFAVSGCVTTFGDGPSVKIVRDLSKVAGCEFRGTVSPPPVQAGLRVASAHAAYLDELKRRTLVRGGTHLYMLNEAAGWGAAQALGTAYRCVS
jgi:predicted small secreted protein